MYQYANGTGITEQSIQYENKANKMCVISMVH